jgi:transposase-like protein
MDGKMEADKMMEFQVVTGDNAQLPGLSPSAFATGLCPLNLDAVRAARSLYQPLHPAGARCPACGAGLDSQARARFWVGERLRCPACGKRFTARTGTKLSGCRLTEPQLFLLLALTGLGLTPATVAKLVGTSSETVRQWVRKLETTS